MIEQENDQTQDSKITIIPIENDKALQAMNDKHEKRKRVTSKQYEDAIKHILDDIETKRPHTPEQLTKQLRKTSHELRKSNEEIDKLLRESNENIDELIDESNEVAEVAEVANPKLLYSFESESTEKDTTEQEKNKENIPPKPLNANPKNTMC